MIFDVFPTILPTITSPIKPVELFSSEWAYGIDEAVSAEFLPVYDAVAAIDLAFITPHGFDILQLFEVSQLNVLSIDYAILQEILGARGFIAYEYGVLIDTVLPFAFLSYDFATAFDLSSFTFEAFDHGELSEIYSIPNLLVYDVAIGLEIHFGLIESFDLAILVEELGDRTLSASDFFIAVERCIKQFPSSDYAQTLDFGRLMIKAVDIASLFDFLSERMFILKDISTAFDRLIERYFEVVDRRLGIDRIIVVFENSCIKILYFAFGIYGFVNIYSIDDFTPPFVVEAKLSPRTAKDHDARLDLYHNDKTDYHPADAYGSYLHAWGAGDPTNDPFKGVLAWGFRDVNTSLRNMHMGAEFEAMKWYVFRIIQKTNATTYEVFDDRRNLLTSSSYGEGHNTFLKIVIGACNEEQSYFTQEVWYDWVFVRKHIEPTPTITIGREEVSPIEW